MDLLHNEPHPATFSTHCCSDHWYAYPSFLAAAVHRAMSLHTCVDPFTGFLFHLAGWLNMANGAGLNHKDNRPKRREGEGCKTHPTNRGVNMAESGGLVPLNAIMFKWISCTMEASHLLDSRPTAAVVPDTYAFFRQATAPLCRSLHRFFVTILISALGPRISIP